MYNEYFYVQGDPERPNDNALIVGLIKTPETNLQKKLLGYWPEYKVISTLNDNVYKEYVRRDKINIIFPEGITFGKAHYTLETDAKTIYFLEKNFDIIYAGAASTDDDIRKQVTNAEYEHFKNKAKLEGFYMPDNFYKTYVEPVVNALNKNDFDKYYNYKEKLEAQMGNNIQQKHALLEAIYNTKDLNKLKKIATEIYYKNKQLNTSNEYK
ncbi:TPA: hypothetical protein HA235_00515 [Candidatus Woesearchaeota archaeon]|nr:hypothetical protein [Candidatus Woesearchaeota archaeon]HIH31167.1 hypothetical protein [Candidatus Woesearchaeota archaeon]HIH55565.1 hypothetical protein [Candidatus Woesearchaeota archaeon]HIJ01812.1 hypothetical protein [Candidatus Woesearchaeota archaeon]HIJ13107.1 hypothetical protein [Candidatus Woesearchaeota archaeon]